ncbi:MAG TPA: DNA-processing protein DprA [Myxococcota bacterium]|nr:DNA-processing protein DprA [Myxococcota bacterium]
MSRADAEYPARLKAKLGQDAPPVLYGCGDRVLLDAGGVAVVGSRDAGELETAFAVEVGRCAAAIEAPVVSGGARGIDQAGVGAALESGGKAIAILADNLGRAVVSQAYRPYLRDRRLTLVSPFDPLAGFTVGHAMQRNKLIYAFADVAFVASSAFESGGTWSGAVEQLDKLRFAPVYVRHDESSSGLRGLREKGALVAPKSITPEILRAVLVDTASRARDPSAKQRTLAL